MCWTWRRASALRGMAGLKACPTSASSPSFNPGIFAKTSRHGLVQSHRIARIMRVSLAVLLLLIVAVISVPAHSAAPAQAGDYPFLNPDLSDEARITDLISRMTLDEKIDAMANRASVPRLGVVGSPHIEGYHGVAQGGPSNWGQRNPTPTTQFPQAYGLGATWDPELLKKVAAQEALEARYLYQSPAYNRAGLIVRAPNADLARDPRWGRTEEVYGEDPFLVGTLATAFTNGLQGDHPRYWMTVGAAQALPREQQRRPPHQLLVELRRTPVARVLRVAVRPRHRRGRVARHDGRLQRGERHAGARAPDAPRHRDARMGRGRHHLHRRERVAPARDRPQGVPGPAVGRGRVRQGGHQPLPRSPEGAADRSREARSRHRGRTRRGAAGTLPRVDSSRAARPEGPRAVFEDWRAWRSGAVGQARDEGARARGDAQVHRAAEEQRRAAAVQPREDPLDCRRRAR